ncbi:MAG: hypothetical protein AB1644_00590 [Candidatus Zixiibacteriota bacterium]
MFTHKTLRVASSLLLLLALALLGLSGCDSKSKQPDVPANSDISLSAPSTMNTGSTSVVVATITAGTSPVADEVVTFTVSPPNAGYFTPAVDTTDANGEAATIFTASTSGAATITASVSGSTLSATSGLAIQQDQSQTGSGNVNVSVAPSLLLANGADTATVNITVRDAVGALAPDSTVVLIVAGEKFVDNDDNGFWSQGIDSLVFDANANGRWDALGIIQSTAMTSGGTGQVSVQYISGNDALTVYVKATVNSNGITGFGEVPLQLSPNATIASIYLASDSMNLAVKQTGGIETALLRATAYDPNGNPVPEGLTVNFIITDGPGGGEHLANVGMGPFAAVTNSQGTAITTIHSGTVSGTVRIRAYADTVLSEATQVLISAGPPQYIVVGAEKCNVAYWDNVVGENIVSAIVSDVYLNPVNDSTVVYFSTDEGTMKSHEERTKDHEGIALSKWFSGNNVTTANGRVLVIAETNGGTVVDTSMFYNSHYTDTLTVIGAPATMLADGTSKAVVILRGVDLNGNPVIGGTLFKADANYLTVQGGTLEDGCLSATSRATIESAVLDMDQSRTFGNDDGIGATDYVQFWCEPGAGVVVAIQMLTGNAYAGRSTVNCVSSAAPLETIDIGASIKDRWGNPLGDHTLNVSVGATALGSMESDSYGEAYGVTWTPAASDTGSFTVRVVDADPRGGITITKKVTVQSN